MIRPLRAPFLGLALVLGACRTGSPEASRLVLAPAVRFGPVRGFLQVPAGGSRGSTSPRRPKLDELGVRWAAEPGLTLRAAHRGHELGAEVWSLALDGTGQAHGELSSAGRAFPGGSRLQSSSSVLTWAVHYGHRLTWRLGQGGAISLAPRGGASRFAFDYRLRGESGRRVNRRLSKITPVLGLDATYRSGASPWRWRVRGALGIEPFLGSSTRETRVWELEARARLDLGRHAGLEIGLGFRRLDFRDDQPVPNRFHVDFGPWIGLGLDLGL